VAPAFLLFPSVDTWRGGGLSVGLVGEPPSSRGSAQLVSADQAQLVGDRVHRVRRRSARPENRRAVQQYDAI
jgi:hypothetical protein